MPARPRVVGVSLKMYMGLDATRRWLERLRTIEPGDVELFVVPSFLSLRDAGEILAGTAIALGAQDVFWEDAGPYTGEVSAPMLVEAGCRFVEIGHAERRHLFHETDAIVAAKTRAAVRAGLVPVLCIGETGQGDPAGAVEACWSQFEAATRQLGPHTELVVAWEPVWAIGAAEPAAPDYILAVAGGLRARLDAWPSARLIYGGSAGPGLMHRIGGAVDGLFLGRFAHDVDALRRILAEANVAGD